MPAAVLETEPLRFDDGGGTRVAVFPPFATDVVAVGGELKNTVCLGLGDAGWLSHVHGDLTDAARYRAFLRTAGQATNLRNDAPPLIAHDLHPQYLSTLYARRRSPRCVPVQHHHAHAVACAVDADFPLPVVAIVCDGTGYGLDGAVWGGEVLVCHARGFERAAHLRYFALPGGDAAAKDTWRPALGLLAELLTPGEGLHSVDALRRVGAQPLRLAIRQMEARLNAPRCSSLGRLFDGVAFLAGGVARNESEGQAAIALEKAAGDDAAPAYPWRIRESEAPLVIDWTPMVREIVSDTRRGAELHAIAARFHTSVIEMLARAAELVVQRTGYRRIVLSGGCFHNVRLRGGLLATLRSRGMAVAAHQRVSTGDAGLALGQAVIAAAITAGAE